MRIQIDYEVSSEKLSRIEKLLSDTAERDVDFNGVDFVIVRGDGTELIDSGDRDPYDVARLFGAIQSVIAGTWEDPEGYRRDSTGKMIEINA